MKTNTLDTSIEAWHSIPCAKLKTQNDRIEHIVRAADADMSLGEIKVIYRALFQRDLPDDKKIEANTISRAVGSLIAANRLCRDMDRTRKCTLTGETVHPVSLPMVTA